MCILLITDLSQINSTFTFSNKYLYFFSVVFYFIQFTDYYTIAYI